MNLKDLAVISGFPGVQRIVATRNNGVMAEDIDSGKVRFAPARKHQISPLESISIFTADNDAVELAKVFQTMLDKLEEMPPPSVKAPSEELRNYFLEVLPNHDQTQVHISDIKKIIRWFLFLNERGFLTAPDPDETGTESESTEAEEQ